MKVGLIGPVAACSAVFTPKLWIIIISLKKSLHGLPVRTNNVFAPAVFPNKISVSSLMTNFSLETR